MLREQLDKAHEQMRNMSNEFQTKLRGIENDKRNENRQMTADVRYSKNLNKYCLIIGVGLTAPR